MSNKYRTDVVADYDELMNTVREHWERVDNESLNDGFSRAPNRTKNPFTPAHARVDVQEAYTQNLIGSQYINPEVFGRKRLKRAVVKSSGASGSHTSMPPQGRPGQAGLPPPTKGGSRGVPQWASRDVKYEEAIALIEQRALVASRTLAAGLTLDDIINPGAAAPRKAKPVAATAGDDRMETQPSPPDQHPGDGMDAAAQVAHVRVEATDPNFNYTAGESYFERLADGALIVGGVAEWIDLDRTQTHFGRPVA